MCLLDLGRIKFIDLYQLLDHVIWYLLVGFAMVSAALRLLKSLCRLTDGSCNFLCSFRPLRGPSTLWWGFSLIIHHREVLHMLSRQMFTSYCKSWWLNPPHGQQVHYLKAEKNRPVAALESNTKNLQVAASEPNTRLSFSYSDFSCLTFPSVCVWMSLFVRTFVLKIKLMTTT